MSAKKLRKSRQEEVNEMVQVAQDVVDGKYFGLRQEREYQLCKALLTLAGRLP